MSIDYKDAGVDVERGYEAVRRMRSAVEATHGPEVLSGLGGFGGLFAPDLKGMEEPVLVSGTDGVGTKLKLAFALDRHDTIGIDCVAMCANDVVAAGARPLFFLDYIATGRLEPDQIQSVVTGIAEGCRQAGAALVGGETAEMPGFYASGEYDVAGFCVGLVDRKDLIDGSRIESGDVLIGLESSGVHSNGFSLIRKLFPAESWSTACDGRTLGEVLLEPTRIYVKPVLELVREGNVKGIAHITGGGFIENIPRMFQTPLQACIQTGSWPIAEIFHRIQTAAELDDTGMFNTFNMGIGMVLAVAEPSATKVLEQLQQLGVAAHRIGHVNHRQTKESELCFE